MVVFRKYWPWIISILFHTVVISSISKSGYSRFKREEIREVKFLESLPPKVNPKAQKVIKKTHPPPPPPEKVVVKPKKPEIEIEVPPISEVPEEAPRVELKEVLDVAEMQAKIDIKSLESALELEGVDKLIVVKERGMSTEEILEAPPIPPIALKEGGEALAGEGILGGEEGGEGKVILTTRAPELTGIETVSPLEEEEMPKLKLPKKEGSKLPQVELVGPITKRKIVKKVLPTYPEWARRKGIFGSVSIKFWVRPDGGVKRNFVIIHSSLSPELDKLVQKSLKEWRFEPLPEGVDEIQWGIITIIFELE